MERLTQNEMTEVLQRAEEIQRQEQAKIEWTQELQQWVGAAEEAGLSRVAIEQALRERTAFSGVELSPGEKIFAKSMDGRFYIAKLVDLSEDGGTVEFINGGRCKLSQRDMRPLNLVPGSKVECDWPNWGWWTCTIVSYNHELNTIHANDGWGQTRIFPISEIRLRGEEPKQGRFWERYGVAIGSLMAGSGVGALITWLLMR